MQPSNSLISESIQDTNRRPDWLSVTVVLLSLIVSVMVAATVGNLGFLALLAIPAALAFIGAIAQPELGLAGFLIITFTQLSNVGIKYHGLPSLAQPLAGLLIVIILVRMAVYGERPLGWMRAGFFLLVYAASWLISLLHAPDAAAANTAFIGFLKDALGMLIVVYFIQHPRSLRRAVWALILAGLFMGTITVYQYLTASFDQSFWGFGGWAQQVGGAVTRHRMTGPYANPNAYAQIMVVIAPLALERVWHERRFWLRLLAAVTLAMVVLTIFFTFSRGGFISLIFAIGVLLSQRRFNFIPLVVTALLVLGLAQFLPASYAERINSLVQLVPSGSSQLVDPSFLGRLSENTVAWRMFRDHPILGVGLGNYSSLYQDYARNLGLENRRDPRSPASLYLELIAEQGLLGSLIFASLLFFVFKGLMQARRHFVLAGLRDESLMASAILAGLAGYLFEAIFKNSAYSNVFWVLIGLALAAIQVAQAGFIAASEAKRADPQESV